MSQILPYLLGAFVVLALLSAVPASLYGLSWLRAKRVAQNSLAARLALEGLEGLAATIVAAAASEVADLKDPTKPGAWNAAVAARIFQRAVYDLAHQGGQFVADLRALQRLTPQAVEALLEAAVEGQVAKLRALRGAGTSVVFGPPAVGGASARDVGRHLAEQLSAAHRQSGVALAPGPLRGGTIRLGLAVAPPPHGGRAGGPPADRTSPAR